MGKMTIRERSVVTPGWLILALLTQDFVPL